MATSSILTNVVIEDPKKAEAFVDALEKSSQDPVWKPSAPSIPILDSVEDAVTDDQIVAVELRCPALYT